MRDDSLNVAVLYWVTPFVVLMKIRTYLLRCFKWSTSYIFTSSNFLCSSCFSNPKACFRVLITSFADTLLLLVLKLVMVDIG